jgi:hypothetical protein
MGGRKASGMGSPAQSPASRCVLARQGLYHGVHCHQPRLPLGALCARLPPLLTDRAEVNLILLALCLLLQTLTANTITLLLHQHSPISMCRAQGSRSMALVGGQPRRPIISNALLMVATGFTPLWNEMVLCLRLRPVRMAYDCLNRLRSFPSSGRPERFEIRLVGILQRHWEAMLPFYSLRVYQRQRFYRGSHVEYGLLLLASFLFLCRARLCHSQRHGNPDDPLRFPRMYVAPAPGTKRTCCRFVINGWSAHALAMLLNPACARSQLDRGVLGAPSKVQRSYGCLCQSAVVAPLHQIAESMM